MRWLSVLGFITATIFLATGCTVPSAETEGGSANTQTIDTVEKPEADEVSQSSSGSSAGLTTQEEQAAQSARSYLDFSSFSKSGLIDQLKFDDFTSAQATQAANRLFG